MNTRTGSVPIVILGTAFLMSAVVGQEGLAAERLAAPQMDAVTAGTLIVAVVANAQAIGDHTYTHTQTETDVYSIGGLVEIGVGSGVASACCSSSSTSFSSSTKASVSTWTYADGENVLITMDGLEYSTAESSFAYGGVTAISFDTPPPQY